MDKKYLQLENDKEASVNEIEIKKTTNFYTFGFINIIACGS
jgi:hypothetical protein